MNSIWLAAFLLLSLKVQAQPYIKGGNTRHRFAQLNVGVDFRFFNSSQSNTNIINEAGNKENKPLGNLQEGRIIIGGTHFWGKADFYMAFPVAKSSENGFSTGVDLGARYFPCRIKHKRVSPFVGISILETRFKQGDGMLQKRFKYPAMAGVVYNFKNHLFELSAGYNYSNTTNYFISKQEQVKIKTQPFWISAGYKFMLETTLSAEKNWQSGKTKLLTDTLAKLKRLNGITFGVGPSSAFFLKKSSHNKLVAPYIDNHKATVFPEFTVGYYLHKPDAQLNFVFRNLKSEINGYDFFQQAKRKAFSFEAYKFFADYNGFAAFAGVVISYEKLYIRDKVAGLEINHKNYQNIKPALTLGWDIRPNRIQSWYLRTHVRYFPNMNLDMPDDKNFSFDQLEFNFIQLVIFPGRMF